MDYNDLQILFEDNHVIVVLKPHNVPSQEDSSGDPDMLNLVKEYVKNKYDKQGNVYVGLCHRLDRPTGGVMIFAKTSKAASRIAESIKSGDMEKEYLAVIVGEPKEKKARLVNYLKKNPVTNTVYLSSVAVADSKLAELDYELLETKSPISLLKVNLGTGRSHQIRVQLSNIGCPVFGDTKYGGNIARGYDLALFAYKLKITHPVTKERLVFIAYPDAEKDPWKRFDIEKHLAVVKGI